MAEDKHTRKGMWLPAPGKSLDDAPVPTYRCRWCGEKTLAITWVIVEEWEVIKKQVPERAIWCDNCASAKYWKGRAQEKGQWNHKEQR